MEIVVERVTEEVQLGARCACGHCHPTATAYCDDPAYERHDPRLAEGPCCCGRFFTIGRTAEEAIARAEAIAAEGRKGLTREHYELRTQTIPLPWGGEIVAAIADFANAGWLPGTEGFRAGARIKRGATTMAIDPVCLMEVDVDHPAATSERGGVTYYFCARGCKVRFDREPSR